LSEIFITLAESLSDRDMDHTPTDFAEAAIRDHLARFGNSADTLDGVHQWWIRWESFPDHISVTERALARLQASGLVECVRMGGGEIWRLRRS
jgi:hypothetical protein